MHKDLSDALPEQLKSQFEVTRQLAYGGHSTVVAAHDRSTSSEVAIKLILDHSIERKLGKLGIIDKLNAIRTLRHPNILPISDLGYASGTLYIVMPLLAGPSLEALMWQKPFSALQTCEWVAQVCRALSAAHSKAIVHGMLRPSSIFVSITDENASLLQLGGFERAILRKALLDGEMYMMGTPSPYDAPEYLFEGKIGPRSDLWAAGMLGYQLVTGRLPYRASGGETLFSMMRGDPPLEFEPTVPIELRNCIARLLRTRHDLRPDSADLVAQELDLVRRSSGNDNYWTYDVAISFAGEDRSLARSLTSALREKNARVFYDEDQAADIWGKNLADYLPEVYRRDARFCIILVSKHYASKAWPNHERRAALDRAIREFDRDYILPIRLDDTNLPGLSESTAYVSASKGIDYISDLVIDKLRRSRPAGGGAWPVR